MIESWHEKLDQRFVVGAVWIDLDKKQAPCSFDDKSLLLIYTLTLEMVNNNFIVIAPSVITKISYQARKRLFP